MFGDKDEQREKRIMKPRRSKRLRDQQKNSEVECVKETIVGEFLHFQWKERDALSGRIATESKDVFLDYVLKDNVMDMVHTYVSPPKRGQRLGGKIVSAGFELAVRKGWKVKPSCTYISDTFLPRTKGKWSAHIVSSL